MSRPTHGERAGAVLARVDELELEIEKLVTGGEGLARHQGIPIFVPRTAPGDRVRAKVVGRRPDYGRAEVVELLAPGPGRRPPPCPVFERCGGCDLQHLGDDVQLRAKVEAAAETLRRLGGIDLPADVAVVPGQPLGYRLRTQLQIADGERGREVGYFARGSHALVPVDGCPILVPALGALLPSLPGLLGATPHRRLDLAVGDDGAISVAPVVEGLPHGEVTVEVGGLVYGFDARCFFQGHRPLLPTLVETALGGELADSGEPANDGEPADRGELAVDLYCGVGLFSLALARRYRRVVAVDGDRVAIRYARANAKRNRLPNVTFHARSVDGWIGELPKGADRILVDPPRNGLGRPVVRALVAAAAGRLTYVSCHPATLARDLRGLARAYRLTRLVFLDMFPQTGHLEVVAQLVRRQDSPGGEA